LNELYKTEKALYQYGFEHRGFQWVDYGDRENSVMIYQRQADAKGDIMIVICNFTPAVRYLYRVGVPFRGQWKEVFNSDHPRYGGSGLLNQGLLNTSPVKFHGRDYSVSLNLPPLAISILKLEKEVSEFELQDIGT
jgi:1,4-alpha-glucan branching enzyme